MMGGLLRVFLVVVGFMLLWMIFIGCCVVCCWLCVCCCKVLSFLNMLYGVFCVVVCCLVNWVLKSFCVCFRGCGYERVGNGWK